MNLRDFNTWEERNAALEKETGSSFSKLKSTFSDEVEMVHCENLIGAISLPLGVAGPLKIQGEKVNHNVYIPLATTEGALVASVSRGCKAISSGGDGVVVQTELVGTTRGPVFKTKGIRDSKKVKEWVHEHFTELAANAETTSNHLKLIKIETAMEGQYLYLRCVFDTQDAMGMNMVTLATDMLSHYIELKTGIKLIAVAGNFDVDKKPSFLNMIEGRGRKGWGEITISKDVVVTVLKSEPTKIVEVVKSKNHLGSMMSGTMGYNAHFANITAAFFAATGQDLAHVVEGSTGITDAEVTESGDLYMSVYLPSIMIGIVGGGTKLKTQTEARSMMNVMTTDDLAEIYIGAVLAGELSLLSSLAAHTLACSHKRLGR